MMELLPAVLAQNETDFKQRILHPELRQVASTFHVDVLDGTLFHAHCWAEAKIVGSWKKLPDIELHCMVQDPLHTVQSWLDYVPTLKRVVVHYEIGRSLTSTLAAIRGTDLEIMVAINPATAVDCIARLPIDGLVIMGVEPGRSGQPFLGEPILSKIRRAKSLFPHLSIAVDGGVSGENINKIFQAGAVRCAASSALWKAENPAEAYEELLQKVY